MPDKPKCPKCGGELFEYPCDKCNDLHVQCKNNDWDYLGPMSTFEEFGEWI